MNLGYWYLTIYDRALVVKGPSVFSIEQEWLNRWEKQYKSVPVHCHLFNQIAVDENKLVDINIAVTNAESSKNYIKDIKAVILDKINNAKQYIYAECFIFSDPELVQAVAVRIQADDKFKVYIMLPPPEELANGYNQINHLNYYTLIKLSLTRKCKSITLRNDKKDEKTIDGDDLLTCEPKLVYSQWLYESYVSIKFKNDKHKDYGALPLLL